MREQLKKAVESLPYPWARVLAHVPMGWRLGPDYNRFVDDISLTYLSLRKKQLSQINRLIEYSSRNIPFFSSLYGKNENYSQSLRSLYDLSEYPIIKKSDFQKIDIASRSIRDLALKKSNTGGTTGQPLDFYIEKSAYAREWAHMHAIWATLGYRYTDEKLTIRGKNIGSRFFKYNFNQNEFLINAYAPLEDNIDACRQLITKRNIKWIH